MLGLPYGKVFLVPWTEEWEIEFMKEKQIIEEQIGEHILAIHHIGSTSIPYLSAKPIIDIAIELKDNAVGIQCIAKLELLNYKYRKMYCLKDTILIKESHELIKFICMNKEINI